MSLTEERYKQLVCGLASGYFEAYDSDLPPHGIQFGNWVHITRFDLLVARFPTYVEEFRNVDRYSEGYAIDLRYTQMLLDSMFISGP